MPGWLSWGTYGPQKAGPGPCRGAPVWKAFLTSGPINQKRPFAFFMDKADPPDAGVSPGRSRARSWGVSQRCPEASQPVPPWLSAGHQLTRPPQRRHLYGETHQPICTANGLWGKGVKDGAKALSPCAGFSL